MNTQDQLLSEIESFLRTKGIAETTFGRLSVNDGKFVGRLRAGGTMTLPTVDRVRQFIRENAGKAPSARATPSPAAQQVAS